MNVAIVSQLCRGDFWRLTPLNNDDVSNVPGKLRRACFGTRTTYLPAHELRSWSSFSRIATFFPLEIDISACVLVLMLAFTPGSMGIRQRLVRI